MKHGVTIYTIRYLLIISFSLLSCRLLPSEIHFIANEYYNLACTFENEGNEEKATIYYKRTLENNPEHFYALFKLANIAYNNHNLSEAIEYCKKATEVSPEIPQAHYNLGLSYLHQQSYELAAEQFIKTIEHDPKHTRAYINLGHVLEKQDKHKEAIDYYKKACAIDPQNSDAYHRLGNTLRHLEYLEEAVEYYRQALSIHPNHTGILMELANTLNTADQTNEALDLYIKVLEINPKLDSALYNFGYTLKKLGHMDKAIEIYQKLLERNPNYALAHFGLASAYLATGDLSRGWQEYEWRFQAYNENPKKFDGPLWNGENITGKTILIYAEQGLGDTLQFIRYALLLKKRGAKVIFQTQAPLTTLLSLCPYIDFVIPRGKQLPPIDYQLPLISLARIFNTQLDTIPADIPYLYAKPELVTYWKAKLASDTNIKIGICWQGNARYNTQSLRRAVATKSIPLEKLASLSRIEGISLYNLQLVDGIDQLKDIHPSCTIHTFDDDFDKTNGRFMDTAAVIKNLDLVISVDTATGHLAGGLGVPVWLLLPYPTDWRWLQNRTDSPWYPKIMRLFQQPTSGNWDGVMQKVTQELILMLGRKKRKQTQEKTNRNFVPQQYAIEQKKEILVAVPDMLLTTLQS